MNSPIATTLALTLLCASTLPAFAETGTSDWIRPGTSEYLSGSVTQSATTYGAAQMTDPSAGIGGMDSGMNYGMSPMSNMPPMNGGMNGMSNVNAMNGGMNGMSNVNAMNGGMNGMSNMNAMNGGMNSMPDMSGMNGGMNGMSNMNAMNGGMNGMSNMDAMNGGMNGMDSSPLSSIGGVMGASGADGIGNVMAAAAGIGLAGKCAMNAIGDSMRGMGFSGGFRGRASGSSNYVLSPFGGTGLGDHGPGTLGGGGSTGDAYVSSGSGGGSGTLKHLSRTVNRAIDRNIQYAADSATRRLLYGLWR